MALVVHVYHEHAPALADMLRRMRPALEVVAWTDRAALEAGIAGVEILVVEAIDAGAWPRARSLRLLQVLGTGIDEVDGAGLDPRVAVASTRGHTAAAVAEHAVALLLALHRNLTAVIDNQRERRWRRFATRPLAGQRACVLGAGAIGGRVARALRGLDMEVIEVRRGDSIAAALAGTPFAIAALPLTAETRGAIGAAELASMADHALVVNVGRGEVFDQAALAAAVLDGKLGGVGLDVFATEPLAPDDPLWQLPNAILSPHLAGDVPRYYQGCLERLCINLERLGDGRELEGLVDPSRGY